MFESIPQEFSQPQTIKEKRQRNKKYYVCYLCNRAFGQRSDLTRHFRTHSGVPHSSCEICGRKFSQEGNKNKHLALHFAIRNDDRALNICIASNSFEIKSNTDTNPVRRQFLCKQCGYKCSFPEAAEFHLNSH